MAQGAVGVEIRADDSDTAFWVRQLDHAPTRIATAAERALLATLEGGCQVPVGALATLEDDEIDLRATVVALDGSRHVAGRRRGSAADPAGLGRTLADALIADGAAGILEEIRKAGERQGMTDAPALAGLGVVVTRDEPPRGPLAERLARAGARVLHWPAMTVAPAVDPAPLARALGRLESFDWIVLTSAHAVEAVAAHRAHFPAALRVAAVGAATAAAARERGWRVDRVPAEFNAEALVAAFAAAGDAAGARVLFPAADRAATTLETGLAALGAEVLRVEAYRTLAAPLDRARCLAAAGRGEVDVVTFASPSAVDGLAESLGEPALRDLLARAAVAAIGPTTAESLARRGRAADAVADPSTLDGLVAAVRAARHRFAERNANMAFPRLRMRRLRANAAWRSMVAETTLSPRDFVYPLFVDRRREGAAIRSPACRASPALDRQPGRRGAAAHALGVPAVILFGIPDHKDPEGSPGYDPDGIVPRAIRALEEGDPDPAGVGRRLPLRVHLPRPLRAADAPTARSTTTRRCRCWRAPRSPTRAPAPTPSRRAT